MTTARIPRIWRAISLTITISFLSFPVYAKYSGGTGEPNDPYQIATAEDLMLLGDSPEDYDKHFILTADIDLDPNLPGRKVFDKAVIGNAFITTNPFMRVDGTPFTGVFDGNDHTISHLTITGDSYLGLFGLLVSGAEVRNLGVVNVNIASSGYYVGGLAGWNEGAIIRSYATGVVSGKGDIGGLVGGNGGDVVDCYSTSRVSGEGPIGGLIGTNLLHWPTLSISSARSEGLVARCFSAGVTNGGGPVGGLVGANGGEVSNSYSTSTVSGNSSVGGLVGNNCVGVPDGPHWISNYEGLVAKCYSTGLVSANSGVGGLVGDGSPDSIVDCFWDTETSTQVVSAGGSGKTTDEMQAAQTFQAWGTCGNEGIWTIDEGRDYPRLRWQNRTGEPIVFASNLEGLLEGKGTEQNPYLVYTAEEFNLLGLFPCDWDKHFKLMANIDLSRFDGRENRPAFNIIGSGNEAFAGIFDGKGHVISNLTLTGHSYLGLFGSLQYSAMVKNMGVVDVNIAGSGSHVGGLVGWNGGTVSQCYSTGAVTGIGKYSDVGGLVGQNAGNINTCNSSVTVSGRVWVGGLVGENHGLVSQCSSTGFVSGNSTVGGLVGHNSGDLVQCYSTELVSGCEGGIGGLVGYNGGLVGSSSVIQCYSTGVVTATGQYADVGGLVGYNRGTVNACFWDTETSGQGTSSGGIGKTTAEMQMAGTFLDAGWDFVDETANGTEDIWWILEGKDYPKLWWEAAEP